MSVLCSQQKKKTQHRHTEDAGGYLIADPLVGPEKAPTTIEKKEDWVQEKKSDAGQLFQKVYCLRRQQLFFLTIRKDNSKKRQKKRQMQ
jgi:hypothetical protein